MRFRGSRLPALGRSLRTGVLLFFCASTAAAEEKAKTSVPAAPAEKKGES